MFGPRPILLGADHAGFHLKETIKAFLLQQGRRVEDLSPVLLDGDDYPLIGRDVAERAVKRNQEAILVCGTGAGVAMAANRVKGIRAVVAKNETDARTAREEDLANVLALGGRMTTPAMAKKIVLAWLATKPSKEKRFVRRARQLDQ